MDSQSDTPQPRGNRRSLSDRLQLAAARLIARLPDRVKIALSGEPAIVIDGQQLDPQAQFLRSVRRRRLKYGPLEPSVDAGRRRYRRQAVVFRGPTTPVGAVLDFEIPAGDHQIVLRHYAPPGGAATRPPLLVYFHGGGFVIGDLDTHDAPCRILCREAGTHVLSVGYRLAPEHPFPAALDDALTAYRWALANATSLGADPDRVAVGGDSAGGNLSAVVSLLERDERPPAAQLLIYPSTDAAGVRLSHAKFDGGFVLTRQDCKAFFRCYTGHRRVDLADPRISPLRAPNHANAPPALIVVAGFDVLRDDGLEYAEALAIAGTHVEVRRFPSLEHGFVHTVGICPAAHRAVVEIGRHWRVLVESAATVPVVAHPAATGMGRHARHTS
jgi:acetyl esterase